MVLQKNIKNESCLDFSAGHFKLLHMKIGAKIKKLRILGFFTAPFRGGVRGVHSITD